MAIKKRKKGEKVFFLKLPVRFRAIGFLSIPAAKNSLDSVSAIYRFPGDFFLEKESIPGIIMKD